MKNVMESDLMSADENTDDPFGEIFEATSLQLASAVALGAVIAAALSVLRISSFDAE